jgi:hypothetical protein
MRLNLAPTITSLDSIEERLQYNFIIGDGFGTRTKAALPSY